MPELVLRRVMLAEPHLTHGLVRQVLQEPLETPVRPVMLASAQLRPMLQRAAELDRQAQLEPMETQVLLVTLELVQEMVVMVF